MDRKINTIEEVTEIKRKLTKDRERYRKDLSFQRNSIEVKNYRPKFNSFFDIWKIFSLLIQLCLSRYWHNNTNEIEISLYWSLASWYWSSFEKESLFQICKQEIISFLTECQHGFEWDERQGGSTQTPFKRQHTIILWRELAANGWGTEGGQKSSYCSCGRYVFGWTGGT